MHLTGIVENGAIKLPEGLELPEGAEVDLTPLCRMPAYPPYLNILLSMAKPRDWPEDLALHHGQYLEGEARR